MPCWGARAPHCLTCQLYRCLHVSVLHLPWNTWLNADRYPRVGNPEKRWTELLSWFKAHVNKTKAILHRIIQTLPLLGEWLLHIRWWSPAPSLLLYSQRRSPCNPVCKISCFPWKQLSYPAHLIVWQTSCFPATSEMSFGSFSTELRTERSHMLSLLS